MNENEISFMGTVNVNMLNVREEPNTESEIICILNVDTMVEIDPKESTDEFYKIYTASGIEGYCMRQFITI